MEMVQTEEAKTGQNPSLAPVDLTEIPEISRAGKASKVVEEFRQSGMQAAVVGDHTPSFATSLKRYVKSLGENADTEVVTRKGTIYLRRTDATPVEAPQADNASE